MDSKTIMKLVLLVVVCAAFFFGYRYIAGGNQTELAGVTVVGQNGQPIAGEQGVDLESQQFLTLLNSVQNVGTKIKEGFVQDRLFLLLQDYTVPVSPKPVSRANPFLPIGVGGAYVAGSQNNLTQATATTNLIVSTSTDISSSMATTTSAKATTTSSTQTQAKAKK